MRNTLVVGIMTVTVSLAAHAQNFGAGACNFPNTQMFQTIQLAVNAVPPGSTIAVCPGQYPEQVTISKPLTLQGRAFGNGARASITANPNIPATANVTSIDGETFYAQLVVENVNPPGPVNLTGITVDGAGVADANGTPVCTTGIFYGSGTSGTLNEVTTRNQQAFQDGPIPTYCGRGIWAENGAGIVQNVTVENSSVHDFGRQGIVTLSDQASSTLAAIIYSNFVSGLAAPRFSMEGIDVFGGGATVTNNFITQLACLPACGPSDGIVAEDLNDILAASPVTITNNTIASDADGYAINLRVPGSAQGNKTSNTFFGIWACGDFTAVSLDSNSIFNTTAALLGCGGPVGGEPITATNHIINDSGTAFMGMSGATLQGNQVHNADVISQ